MNNPRLATLDKETVPLLREVYPREYLLFVFFEDADSPDFLRLASRNGYDISGLGAAGIAFVRHGYALVEWMAGGSILSFAYSMDHEMTHIETCMGHNDPFDPVDEWFLLRDALFSKFC